MGFLNYFQCLEEKKKLFIFDSMTKVDLTQKKKMTKVDLDIKKIQPFGLAA